MLTICFKTFRLLTLVFTCLYSFALVATEESNPYHFDFNISISNLSLNGSINFSLDNKWIEGELNAASEDLAIFEEWLPIPLKGKIACSAKILRSPLTTIEVDFISPEMTIDSFTVNNVEFSGKATDIFGNPRGYIQHFQGEVAGVPFHLRKETAFQITPSNIIIDPTIVNLGRGSVAIEANFNEQNPHCMIHVEDFPLSIMNRPLHPTALNGTISGSAVVEGPPSATTIKMAFQLKNFSLNENIYSMVPPVDGRLNITLSDQSAACVGNFLIDGYPPITLEANLPITCSLYPPQYNIDYKEAISGRLTAAGELSSIFQILLSETPFLTGTTHLSIEVSGNLDNPYFSGTCDINDGTFELPNMGTNLKALSAHFEAKGSEILLTQLHASDQNGGTVSGNGSLTIDLLRKFPFTLDLIVQNTNILDTDSLKGNASGQLTLSGDYTGGNLSGTISSNKISFVIPERTPALMNYVEVTYINLPENEPPPHALDIPSFWPLTLNIDLNIPGNLTISSQDLTSEWKGSLSIQGSPKSLLLMGGIKVIQGQYLFNGQPFNMNQGSISFAGDIDKKTTLYVIANKDLKEVKIDVILKGLIKNPSISFRSNPPLPQREILSWLLFNRGTSEISPFQGSQLSESITNLDTRHQGPDVLTKIRSALRIDRLEISRNANSETNSMNVQIGKYISDNVLISINKSDVNQLGVEATLSDKIKFNAQVGDNSEGQMFLKWKKEY